MTAVLQFVNPALLFGALLFAVPLIIHLLNRQRHKRRAWAAMEFLLAAYRKNRRRLRTENLILLLLRCLIPIVLALAIARPVLRDNAAVGGFGGTAHHVLVLDESYSMGLQPEGMPSPFRHAKEMATQLLDRLERRQGHKVTILQSGIRPTLLGSSEDMNIAAVKPRLAATRGPLDAAKDLTPALLQVAELVENATDAEQRVYVFTDMQARAFGELDEQKPPPDQPVMPPTNADDAFKDTIHDAIERIGKRAELVFLDVGGSASESASTRADNLQVTGLDIGRAHAIARVPTPVVVSLRNRTDGKRVMQVTLEIEGSSPTRQQLELEAGAEGQIEFPVTFSTAGLHHLRASIDANDGLPADNERFLVVRVRERISLLLVEGFDDESDPALMSSEQLRAVLDPTRGEGGPDVTVYAPKTITSTDLLTRREKLQDYDVVALVNITRIDETSAAAISEAMQAGTSLLVMLGSNTDPQSFNLYLHRSGGGPMPMQLTAAQGFQPGGERSYVSSILEPGHPVFAGFDQDVYRDIFQQAPIYRFIGCTDEPIENGEVLARVRDEHNSPLVVVATHGNAKALFLTSAISARPDHWNGLDWLGLSMPFFHEAVNWLTKPTTDPFNVICGEQLTGSERARPTDVSIVRPERAGNANEPVGEDSRALPGGRFSLPRYGNTDYAGIYEMVMNLEGDDGSNRRSTLPFAVNVDPAEGDLTYMSYATARDKLGVPRVLRALPSEGNVAIDTSNSELGVPFLYLALLLLLGETAMARFVARRG